MDISNTALWELQVKLNYSPSLLLTVASVLKVTGFRSKSFYLEKKAFNLPSARKDRKVWYLRHEPSMHYKTSNCIGSSRYSVNIKLPGAVFKFQMLLSVIWKKRRHQAQIRPDWATTPFACRLHILSRPGGCQSLMTEVYYILPNKVTKSVLLKAYACVLGIMR